MITQLMAEKEAIYRDLFGNCDGLETIARWWGTTCMVFIGRGKSEDARFAACHAAHFGRLALLGSTPEPDPRPEAMRWAA